MNLLALPHRAKTADGNQQIFYISSCESASGHDVHDSNISSQHTSSSSSNSSINTRVSVTKSSTHRNSFLQILNRLHRLRIRRKKNGRYRSHVSTLHLFFQKPHPVSSDEKLCNSATVPELPALSSDKDLSTTATKQRTYPSSCQQLVFTGAQRDSKTSLFQLRRSFLRRIQTSDHTVSEDNNTNTLSSLDLTLNPQFVPILTIDEPSPSITVTENSILSSIDLELVSDEPILMSLISVFTTLLVIELVKSKSTQLISFSHVPYFSFIPPSLRGLSFVISRSHSNTECSHRS